jgi:hypothetical protein
MISAFRTLAPALERRLETAATEEDLAPIVRVLAHRVARTAGGLVGTVAGTVLLVVGALQCRFQYSSALGRLPDSDGLLTGWLVASVVAAAVTARLVRLYARRKATALTALPKLTGNPAADLAALDLRANAPRLRNAITRLELASIVLPLIAWSLLAPLAIHYFVGTLLYAATGSLLKPTDFDQWIRLSAVIVGLPHLVLAVCSVFYGRKLRRCNEEGISSLGHGDAFKALGLTVLSSLFPGFALLAIPTVFVFITGVVFVPAVFRTMRNRIIEERLALA